MDKNTIIGWVLIGLIFIGWMTMTNKQAQKEQQAQQKAQKEQVEAEKAHAAAVAVRDSMSADELALLKQNIEQFGGDSAKIAAGNNSVSLAQGQLEGTLNVDGQTVDVAQLLAGKVASTQVNNDALKALRDLSDTYGKNGPLASKLKGTNQIVKLKNDSLEIEISSKGGMITRATLLGWPSANLDEHHKLNTEQKHLKPVELFSPGENSYSFVLNTNERRYDTKDFYFTPRQLNDTTVEMDLNMPGNAMFGIRYTLAKGGNYMVRMELVQRNMEAIVPTNVSDMDFNWRQKMGRHEEGKMFEERNSTIYYQYAESDGGGDVKYLPETSAKEEDMQDRLKWISTKGQFFSAVLIADNSFVGARLKSVPTEQGTPEYQRFLKNLSISSSLDYKSTVSHPASFFFYFGPNRYRILSHYKDMMAKYSSAAKNEAAYNNLELTRLIPLGWTLFRWINTYIVIPVFNWLGTFIHSYGIIILILTILIKLVLSPLTYKSYKSQAVMRILAPDIQAINEKYPGQDNAMKRQQKTMALYNQAGANPMGGCLPMLLQFPILVAVFAFFPSCIELRGQSFLWAHDLSAPDAIVSWSGQIPFITNYFGNHISLFCLLMTATNIIYTYLTMQSQAQSSSMPGMKWMMYLMPVFFLVFFNNYAAGLSYYYFVSLLITIIQTYAIRAMIKEDKVRAQMAANAKKPKKKSGFMARLEEAQRQQQAALREQQKKNGKKRR